MRIRIAVREGNSRGRAVPVLVAFAIALGGAVWANDALCARQHARDAALIEAVNRADTVAAIAALDRGADADARPGPVRSLWRDWLWEARHGRVRYYRRGGLRAPSSGRETTDPVIFRAIATGESALIEALLRRGARVDIRSVTGRTAVHFAESRRNAPILRLLLHHGAKVDAPSSGGTTALMHAAALGHSDIVRLLLGLGADPKSRDKAGRSVLDWAEMYRPNEDTVKLLRAAGAR
jgi:hypothetical protein